MILVYFNTLHAVAVQFSNDIRLKEDDILEAHRNLGLARRARNLRVLQVELAMQYTVMICASTGLRLSTQPLLTNCHWFDCTRSN